MSNTLFEVRVAERSVEGRHSIINRIRKRCPAARCPYISLEFRFDWMRRVAATTPEAPNYFCFNVLASVCHVCLLHTPFTESLCHWALYSTKSFLQHVQLDHAWPGIDASESTTPGNGNTWRLSPSCSVGVWDLDCLESIWISDSVFVFMRVENEK